MMVFALACTPDTVHIGSDDSTPRTADAKTDTAVDTDTPDTDTSDEIADTDTADTSPDSDTADSGDTATDLCATASGWIDVEPDEVDISTSGVILTLDGGGVWVCQISCSDPWLEAHVVEPGTSGCGEAATLPYYRSGVDGDDSICISLGYDPGPDATDSTCTLHSSAGDVSVGLHL